MTVILNDQSPYGGHAFVTGFGATPVFFEGEGVLPGAPTEPAAEPATPAEPAAAETADTPVSSDPAAPTSPAEPAPIAEPVEDPDDKTIPETLKPYVKQLRDENAERRVTLKPYEDAFGQFEPEEQSALLEVIAGLGNDETQVEAATRLKAVVDAILEGQDDPDRPLTARDLERREAAKEKAKEEEASIVAINKEAADLGYPEGTREQRHLFDVAVNEFGGDLTKAHEAMKASKDAIIAEYAKQVQEGNAKWPVLAASSGQTPADITGAPPKTWAEARRNSAARVAARP